MASYQTYRLTARQRDTILAALRERQDIMSGNATDVDAIDEIATNGGKHRALSRAEIDALCQRLNA